MSVMLSRWRGSWVNLIDQAECHLRRGYPRTEHLGPARSHALEEITRRSIDAMSIVHDRRSVLEELLGAHRKALAARPLA
jgi:hypothetical protein